MFLNFGQPGNSKQSKSQKKTTGHFLFFLNFGHLWEDNWWDGSVFLDFFDFFCCFLFWPARKLGLKRIATR